MSKHLYYAAILPLAAKLRQNWRQEAAHIPLPAKLVAFTLIELSIVLVIIGLIVGGLLVGSDMIKSAKTRAFLAKANQIETAFNSFRVKYNCLPGDCNHAFDLGLGTSGDGDRMIMVPNYAIANTECSMNNSIIGDIEIGSECQLVWVHLSAAGYIEESNLAEYPSGTIVGDQLAQYYPRWGNAYMHLVLYQGKLYLRSGLSEISGVHDRPYFGEAGLDGTQMMSISTKYDIPYSDIYACAGTYSPTASTCDNLILRKVVPMSMSPTGQENRWFVSPRITATEPCMGNSGWNSEGQCNMLYRIM